MFSLKKLAIKQTMPSETIDDYEFPARFYYLVTEKKTREKLSYKFLKE